jgi:hypothetical protein
VLGAFSPVGAFSLARLHSLGVSLLSSLVRALLRPPA